MLQPELDFCAEKFMIEQSRICCCDETDYQTDYNLRE